MEDRLGLHIFVKFLALKTISLWTFICLEVYFLPMPPGLELILQPNKRQLITQIIVSWYRPFKKEEEWKDEGSVLRPCHLINQYLDQKILLSSPKVFFFIRIYMEKLRYFPQNAVQICFCSISQKNDNTRKPIYILLRYLINAIVLSICQKVCHRSWTINYVSFFAVTTLTKNERIGAVKCLS